MKTSEKFDYMAQPEAAALRAMFADPLFQAQQKRIRESAEFKRAIGYQRIAMQQKGKR